ncbi:hypothetical protein IV203_010961 [Nitzschia inconspicua]|uniref:Uncharacterized protein n=1 Tax=Nitzschia inconspicua TaxID=303405 RepID=A0A9K3KYS1_9STRA|nr:hypothetical protein IV203_010961 [Nitzschia inconspicua]
MAYDKTASVDSVPSSPVLIFRSSNIIGFHPANLLAPMTSSDKVRNTIDMIDAALRVVECDVLLTSPVRRRTAVTPSSGPEQ